MDNSNKRARIRRYFKRFPTGVVMGMILIGLLLAVVGGLGAANTDVCALGLLVLVGLANLVGGIIVAVSFSNGTPSDSEMQTYLEEDLEFLKGHARKKLGMEEEDVIAEPLVVAPGLLFASWEQAKGMNPDHVAPRAAKVGKDNVLRMGSFECSVFFPTQKFLGTYYCVFDACEGHCFHESTDEFFYQDIVQVATKTENRAVAWTEKDGTSRSNQVNDMMMFRLTVSSGDGVSIHIHSEDMKRFIFGDKRADRLQLIATNHEKAIQTIRKFLREKK